MSKTEVFSNEVLDLADELRQLDVKLYLDAGNVRFNAPKGVIGDSMIGRLKTHKPELIRLLEHLEAAENQLNEPIPTTDGTKGYPLTFAQQRFWFLDQLAGGNSPIYNMLPIAMTVEGPLNLDALQSALNSLIERHPGLSNKFTIEGDEPRQWPGQGGNVPIVHYVLSGLASSGDKKYESELGKIILDEGEHPFDLQKGGPLLRLGLVKLSDLSHVMILTLHHIIADGWSLGILVAEFSQFYEASLKKKTPNLAEISIQYGDFATWERNRLNKPLLHRYLHHWKKDLSGAPTILDLPTDRPRPRLQTFNGRTHAFMIDKDLAQKVRKCANSHGATPFMVLLSIFGALLGRYSRQDDLVVGSPMSVRAHSDCDPIIGLFLNTIPLRVDLTESPTFTEVLNRLKKRTLKAFEYGEVPFDELLQALNIDRSLNHTPLFQVLFALQNAPVGKLDSGDLTITPIEPENSKAPFDLVLSMEELDNGIRGRFRFNTDLFDIETIRFMSDHFVNLLSDAVSDPSKRVHQLKMMGTEERQKLQEYRGTGEVFSVHQTLAEIIHDQVLKHPDKPAIVFEGVRWNYEQFEQKAVEIASQLHGLGVRRSDRVGIFMGRSADLIATIYAILKLGATYVPLDPAYPTDRIEYMIDDSGVKVVVTDSETKSQIPRGSHQILELGQRITTKLDKNISSEVDQLNQSDQNLAKKGKNPDFTTNIESSKDQGGESQVSGDTDLEGVSQNIESMGAGTLNFHSQNTSPDDVAYIIYTSGSTGRPKGVEVTHANVVRLFSGSESLFGFDDTDVWTMFHSYAFDFSVWEIFGALLYGGKLVVVPYWISRSPDAFFDLIQHENVTVLNQTPSAFQQLMEIDRREGGRKTELKWVVFGGEALDLKNLEGWSNRHGLDQPQLINMYGITETTVHVTYHRISRHDINQRVSVIGNPLLDLTIDLCDEFGQLVPIGVPGEILVGGAGVAKGYLNRPELNAQRFASKKLHDNLSEERLYHSGDLARRRTNGTLQYLGRIDHQVKIRGFRIELGEIESQMSGFSGVSAAVVNVRQTESGNELVGYVVFHHEIDPQSQLSELREHLKKILPEYMVPNAIIVLEKMPLTTNGKIDKKALPDPDRDQRLSEKEFVPPATSLEVEIAEIWSEILHIDKIGLTDNFFELGGDSIKGAIFANRMQQKIGSIFYVVAVFEAPTISELISYMRSHYPEAIRQFEGEQAFTSEQDRKIDSTDLETLRSVITPLPPYSNFINKKPNPRAIFVLAPPRSGTTLLRVLLGGHSRLFAPPELELMPFNTLGERKKICSRRDAFWLEGTLRAVMELHNLDADQAKIFMEKRENADLSVKDFYSELQEWIGDRILVDKSPSYVLDKSILERIEATFENPLFIHLHRHPLGMVNSFVEAKLDQIFFRYPHDFSTQQLAELIWLHSHQNISEFLETVPAHRQMQISFEDMTGSADVQMKRLCNFIGLDFESDMLAIYEENEKKRRMTDGIHEESKMLGDVKFHTHKNIDSNTATRWKERFDEEVLGDSTREMAQKLGYFAEIGQISDKKDQFSSKNDSKSTDNAQKSQTEASGSPDIDNISPQRQKLPISNDTNAIDSIDASISQSPNIDTVSSYHSSGTTNKLDSGTADSVVSVTRDSNRIPLSHAQQRLWFFDQLEGAGNTYNMPVAMWLNGNLDVSALIKSIYTITQRHEVLRSRFGTSNGDPFCTIVESLPPTSLVDLSLLGANQKSEVVNNWLNDFSNASFDLEHGPLFRSALVKVEPMTHLLLINMHHIVSDGWSIGIVGKELEQFYANFASKNDSSQPTESKNQIDFSLLNSVVSSSPLPAQYYDYTRWQHQLSESGEIDRQLSYWKSQLKDIPSLLEIPTDFPRPAIKSYKGRTHSFAIETGLFKRLKQLANASKTTPYMVLMSVFGVILNWYTNQAIIPIGSPVANRKQSNFESLIGFFVNTMVVKLTIDDNIKFDDLLKRVRKSALEAYDHQDVSFEQLVEELQPERNMGYSPLFQVMLTMQTSKMELPKIGDLDVQLTEHKNEISKYDLTLLFAEESDSLTCYAEYSTDIFAEWRIKQLGDHFLNVLNQVADDSSKPIHEIQLLNDRSLQQITNQWNSTKSDLDYETSIVDLIHQQSEKHPSKTALCCGETSITYNELDQRSNQLAHYMLSSGLKPGSFIAVALERSNEMVISLLAILKSGCTYIPLDPTYPANRIEMIFEDANVKGLITNSSLSESIPKCESVILIDTMINAENGFHPDIKLHGKKNISILDESISNKTPDIKIRPEDLAYVIFTSGSTGRPKGVMISHKSLLNFLFSMQKTPGITDKDHILAVTTIAFDIAILEIWVPLISGASIHIASELEAKDGQKLLDIIHKNQVSIMQATPVTWQIMIESGWERSPKLTCLCGGEAMPRQLATDLLNRCHSVWNLYGPTETTVWSTIFQVEESNLTHDPIVPIGKPIKNTSIFILNEHFDPVPIGIPGELYIGGDGVSKGYLNRAELTAERFIENPFNYGSKMYRTGDLARFRSDGVLEYLGRSDQQVKLRGYRIELGEIEFYLQKHPEIKQGVVALVKSGSQPRLVAFYIPKVKNTTITNSNLTDYLRDLLPDYMIPSHFVKMPQFPLTPNRKLDRNKLATYKLVVEVGSNNNLIKPRDVTEFKLAKIWQDILGMRSISVVDNFFELGGHSLIAVRLMARITTEFNKSLPLATIFQHPTIAELAKVLIKNNVESMWDALVPMQKGSIEFPPVFCLPGAGGNILYMQSLIREMNQELSIYGLQPPGLDGITPVFESVESLAKHYIESIKKVYPFGPYRLIGHSFGGLVAFEIARHLERSGDIVGDVIILDTAAPHWFEPTGLDWSNAKWLAQVSSIANHQYGVELGLTQADFESIDNKDSQLGLLLNRLIQQGIFPEGAQLEQLRGFMQVYQSNLQMDYNPEDQPNNLNVVVIRSTELQPDQLTDKKAIQIREERDLGWGKWLKNEPQVFDSPGDHLTMLNSQNVTALATTIHKILMNSDS